MFSYNVHRYVCRKSGGGGKAKKHHPVKHSEWQHHTVGCFTTRGTGTLSKRDEEGKLGWYIQHFQKTVRKLKLGRKRVFQYCFRNNTMRTISQNPDLKKREEEEMDERAREFDKSDSITILFSAVGWSPEVDFGQLFSIDKSREINNDDFFYFLILYFENQTVDIN